jgi:hypothetical protein
MRIPLLFTLIVFFSINLWAQKNKFNHQIGFDAGSFITKYISFSQSSSSTSPYAFTYRKLGDKSNFRLGAGLSFSIIISEDQAASASNAGFFKAGSEKFIDFGQLIKHTPSKERWRFFYGIDGVTSFAFSGNSESENEFYSIGIGPSGFGGFLFNLNERLSLSTELSYDVQGIWNKTNSTSRFNLRGHFIPPTAIFVNFEF